MWGLYQSGFNWRSSRTSRDKMHRHTHTHGIDLLCGGDWISRLEIQRPAVRKGPWGADWTPETPTKARGPRQRSGGRTQGKGEQVQAHGSLDSLSSGTPTSSCAVLSPTLCNPMDYTPPGFSVMWIRQARILEWVAMPPLQGIFPTPVSKPGLLHCRQILYCLSHQEVLLKGF